MTSIELAEVSLGSSGGRRHSFSEAIEGGRETPSASRRTTEEKVDLPPPAPSPPALPEGEATIRSTTKFNIDFSSKMGEWEVPSIFKSVVFWVIVLVIVGIGILLTVILVPLSFADLDYWEIGFSMRRSTGSVDTSRVYGPGGRHALGVDYTFKDFPADAVYAVLNDLSVFSLDRLEVFLDVTFQYFIRPAELQPLHDAYDLQYHEIIISRAESVIKANAPMFNTTDYFINRDTVERVFAEDLFDDLGGTGCCDSYCTGDLLEDGFVISGLDCSNCSLLCPTSQQRFFVDIRYFQLLEVRIPGDVAQQYLNVIILQENAEREQFEQDASIVNLEIERDVQEIRNRATELREEAAANATLIRARAQANATAIVESARNEGLGLLYERLNITDPRHKASLDYLRTLRQSSERVRLHVGFNTAVSGPYNNDNTN